MRERAALVQALSRGGTFPTPQLPWAEAGLMTAEPTTEGLIFPFSRCGKGGPLVIQAIPILGANLQRRGQPEARN